MKYEVKIYINGELEVLEDASIEQIEHMKDYLEKLFYKGGKPNE